MNTIEINGVTIPSIKGNLYSLNALHMASGGRKEDRPGYFLLTKQALMIVDELEKAGIPAFEKKQKVGTYVAKHLMIAYAMWQSPTFAVHVIDVYDQAMSLPEVVRVEKEVFEVEDEDRITRMENQMNRLAEGLERLTATVDGIERPTKCFLTKLMELLKEG